MSNWKEINNESNMTAAMVVLCQDYVLADEEFMSNAKIKKNMNNAGFWIELAHSLHGAVGNHLCNTAEDSDGYDEYEASGVTDGAIMNFVMNPKNRFELNDIICESIDSYLSHFGKKRA